MKMRIAELWPTILGGGLLLFSSNILAVDVNVRITGEIYIPPCTINGNDNPIDVHFGKMALQAVDGQKYAVSKTVSVNCTYYQGNPYVVIAGNAMGGVANNNVLLTTGIPENNAIFGIALYQGASVDSAYPLKIGVGGEKGAYGYAITRGLDGNGANGQFTFTAVPWKQGTADLKAGSFSATVTMSISYL